MISNFGHLTEFQSKLKFLAFFYLGIGLVQSLAVALAISY
jgi:hypothetical protein